MAVRRHISPHERARRKAGYGVCELARTIGVSHTYVSRIEGGQIEPSPRYRESVSRLLGVPDSALFPKKLMTAVKP